MYSKQYYLDNVEEAIVNLGWTTEQQMFPTEKEFDELNLYLQVKHVIDNPEEYPE